MMRFPDRASHRTDRRKPAACVACIAAVLLAAPAPAERCAFVARPDAIAVVNLDVERPSRRIELDFEPRDMALGADGRTLFIARFGPAVSESGPVPIAAALDLTTGEVTDIEDVCEVSETSSLCGSSAIALTPDGATALAVGYDSSCTCVIGEIADPGEGCDQGEHRISAVDARTRQVRRFQTLGFGRLTGSLGNRPCRPPRIRTEVAIAPDGESAVVTDGREDRGGGVFGAMKLRGLRVPSERATLGGSCAECDPRLFDPVPVAWSAGSEIAFVGNTADAPALSIVPVHFATGALGEPIAVLGFAPFALAASAEDVLLAVSGPRVTDTDPPPSIAIIDAAATAAPRIVTLPEDPLDVAVAPDGRTAYVSVAGGGGASLLVFQIESATVRTTIAIDAVPAPGAVAIGTAPGACPPPPGPCVGDCDGDGEIALGEVQTGFQLFLGAGLLDDCTSFDTDLDGEVALGEVQQSFLGFLAGCVPQ